MIQISELTDDDKMRSVYYEREHVPREWGLLTSWNERNVFVLFDNKMRSVACSPEDISWVNYG